MMRLFSRVVDTGKEESSHGGGLSVGSTQLCERILRTHLFFETDGSLS